MCGILFGRDNLRLMHGNGGSTIITSEIYGKYGHKYFIRLDKNVTEVYYIFGEMENKSKPIG